MRHFKLPLLITGIAFALTLVVGLLIVTKIYRSKISDQQKFARVQKLGAGMGTMTVLVIAPFWLFAAAKVGQQRRAARRAAQAARP